MIFNQFQPIAEANVTTLTEILRYVSINVPAFIPMLLFSICCVVMMGTFFATQRLLGRGNFAESFAVGTWFTTFIAILLSLSPGIINVQTLSICLSLSFVGILVFYFTGRD